MTKKGDSNRLWKIKREVIKYRWEFMRRDPTFISSYDNLLKLQKLYKAGGVSADEMSNAVREFRKEFEMERPLGFADRTKSYDELEQQHGKDSLTILALYTYLGNAVYEISSYGDQKVPKDHLILEIDFNKVNSITALKALVSEYIDMYYKGQYLRNHPKRQTLNKVNYDKILAVGDLKKENKLISWEDLGERIFPGDQNGKRKALQHYARYEDMINGGWRLMRFP